MLDIVRVELSQPAYNRKERDERLSLDGSIQPQQSNREPDRKATAHSFSKVK